MDFKNLKRNWEGLGESDAMWSILTVPEYINNQWDEDRFFQSGVHQVNHWFGVFKELSSMGKRQALDFGCGIGRLTQGLCPIFEQVVGVDISAAMIATAHEKNKFSEKCDFKVNAEPHLQQFDDNSFDFICSFITLQHIHPQYTERYLQEFIRILKKDGILLFSLPYEPPSLYKFVVNTFSQALLNIFRRFYYGKKHVMEMHWMDKEHIYQLIRDQQADIIATYNDPSVGEKWKSLYYVVRKG